MRSVFTFLLAVLLLVVVSSSNSNHGSRGEPLKKRPLPSGQELPDRISASWFANWAQYRQPPFNFVPSNMSSVIENIDILYYAFAFFCPNSSMYQPYWVQGHDPYEHNCNSSSMAFQVFSLEPKDIEFINDLKSMRSSSNNPNMKILISIGGWNFPSNFFSEMVSSSVSRGIFIKSLVTFLENTGLDGIDIDWEYPGSKPRMDPVEINCQSFKYVNDSGGTYLNANIDKENFVTLFKEMRENSYLQNKLITFCGQAGLGNVENGFDLKGLLEYADFVNIMTYDYTVSSTNSDIESNATAPNEPLYSPNANNIAQWNLNSTVNGYIEMGASPEQILVGIAFYGHTWYLPNIDENDVNSWGKYGIPATKPGALSNCCNITKLWWGGSAGQHTLTCGFNGYFEIQRAGFPSNAIIDNETMTYISYMDHRGNDEWTPANTWVNYQGIESVKAISKFTNNLNVRGLFGFDISMDGFDTSNNQWTFELTNQVHQCLNDGC